MAKKSSIKVRLVPEKKPDSPFFYYVKKNLLKVKRQKLNSSLRNTIRQQENMKFLLKKNYLLTASKLFFFKFFNFVIDVSAYHRAPNSTC